jgi:hypothetical protein
MGVSLTGDLDADPLTPDATLDAGFNCENESNLQIVGTNLEDFELAEGQITVYEDEVTIVVNIFSSLDVFVRDDVSDLPIAGAEVCLYEDAEMTVLVECKTTDGTGLVRFFFVGDLLEDATFTVNSDATGYEQEATTFEYSLLTDILDGGDLIDDADTADVIQSLDPDIVNFGIVDVLLTLDGVSSAGVVNIYEAGPADVTGASGVCTGTFVTSVNTTDGAVDFGGTTGVTYCFAGDANGDSLFWVETYAVAAGDPNIDQLVALAGDVTLPEGVAPPQP